VPSKLEAGTTLRAFHVVTVSNSRAKKEGFEDVVNRRIMRKSSVKGFDRGFAAGC
jgi:hypothetical protein